MIAPFLSPTTKRILVYPTPIDTRLSPDSLRATCEQGLGIKLDRETGVLFHNRAKTTLILYALDYDGDRCLSKKLERGAFLLPVPSEGEAYVMLDVSKAASLFRSPVPKRR
jgi:hypothetical protein